MRKTGGQYVGHVTPASETGNDITKRIHKYLEDDNVVINELKAIGCDGRSRNSGWKNGVICNIEPTLKTLIFDQFGENYFLTFPCSSDLRLSKSIYILFLSELEKNL
ncbi:hypothetical protein AVEN_261441-1 [Araneus ventricosus]|uniref:Uncharacterized protein n=1 Tax=Araneus ventricosus TaxID=182803 RepID=A0A4Y2NH56_ARAVE|nr:hypothetical protein AVEN_261441-1 [Araneus ventricosus]